MLCKILFELFNTNSMFYDDITFSALYNIVRDRRNRN